MQGSETHQQLFLIAGIPGTGKTETGKHFQEHHGFVHFDAEAFAMSARPGATWLDFVQQVEQRVREGRDVVITWGFMPGTDDEVIRAFQRMGFQLVWFDGDRSAARRIFSRRGTVPLEAFDIQMARIEQMEVGSFNPITINPIESGELRTREAIAGDILSTR